jgi:two-component system response regulator (stage 0 sporulation protein F)
MKKILVGDDEVSIRLLYEQVLSGDGHTVITARDGREAYEKFLTEKPDLVILDVKMPGMHGIEVLERIRETGSDVPIILSTAYQQMESNAAVSTARVACFLSKPIDIARLRAEVRRVLEEKEAGASPQVQNRSSTL